VVLEAIGGLLGSGLVRRRFLGRAAPRRRHRCGRLEDRAGRREGRCREDRGQGEGVQGEERRQEQEAVKKKESFFFFVRVRARERELKQKERWQTSIFQVRIQIHLYLINQEPYMKKHALQKKRDGKAREREKEITQNALAAQPLSRSPRLSPSSSLKSADFLQVSSSHIST